MWNPNENTTEENMRYCQLRAMEWLQWPLFVAQPIAPVALLFFSLWNVVLVIVAVSLLWIFVIRDRVVVPFLAYWGCLFVKLKWLICPAVACILAYRKMYGLAVVALFWPAVTLLIQAPLLLLKPAPIGVFEATFMRSLGYEPTTKD